MSADCGHVYVIAFGNGTVKVGRTANVLKRLREHKGDGRKFGIAVTDSWSSPLHVEWELNEETLKEIAARHGGTPTCAEYFQGADYAAVAAAAARLPFTPPFEELGRRALKCLAGRDEDSRRCIARVGALDARTREVAADEATVRRWNSYRSAAACKRCA